MHAHFQRRGLNKAIFTLVCTFYNAFLLENDREVTVFTSGCEDMKLVEGLIILTYMWWIALWGRAIYHQK